jgi:hypothetical protein
VSFFNFLLPGLCLAFGLWALIVLSRKEVRDAFAGDKTAMPAVTGKAISVRRPSVLVPP